MPTEDREFNADETFEEFCERSKPLGMYDKSGKNQWRKLKYLKVT